MNAIERRANGRVAIQHILPASEMNHRQLASYAPTEVDVFRFHVRFFPANILLRLYRNGLKPVDVLFIFVCYVAVGDGGVQPFW